MLDDDYLTTLIATIALPIIVLLILRYAFGLDTGINPFRVLCPKCSAKMPHIRIPQNERQKEWGGWTCFNCGIEMDKWGKEVAPEENEH